VCDFSETRADSFLFRYLLVGLLAADGGGDESYTFVYMYLGMLVLAPSSRDH
jgi:hypothetical protein